MPYSPGHLTTQTLELLMDEMLSSAERNEAEAHLEGCELCAAELEACRALSVALAGLPRFAPSVTFAESVMARVTIAPQGSLARMRRWLPVTRRGWVMLAAALLAPLAPLVAALGWLLSQPLVTVGGVWSMGEKWTVRALWSFAASAFEATSRSGAW
ncbi:MAG: zf-HC2 domain-containing protein, partial [Gemmatimonadota bacterium]|nr:zf-HC2 domain-containing protein [Gemmatimonadota bacterium]